jgi:hypothetical protein
MEEAEPLLLTGRSKGEATFDISVARVTGVRTIRIRSCDGERRDAGQERCYRYACGECGTGLSKSLLAGAVVVGERALSSWIYEAVYDVYVIAIEV